MLYGCTILYYRVNFTILVAAEFELEPGGVHVVRYVLAWYAPQWSGGWPYDGVQDRFTKMYTARFADAFEVAEYAARSHTDTLRSVKAWQDVIYGETSVPGWLRDGLVNILHLVPECGFWAGPRPPLGDWCFPEGVFSLIESTDSGGHQTCIPCDTYGNLPIVYFFPDAARTTLRALAHYTREDGAVPFNLGQGLELGDHFHHDQQRTLNGCCFVDMVGRLWQRTGDDGVLREFFATVKASIKYMIGLVPGSAGVISTAGDQWYESMAWPGMSSHVGGVRLATLRLAERMGEEMADETFAAQCRVWYEQGSEMLESHLWAGTHYMLFNDPDTDANSDLMLSHQLDGEWITQLHGLPHVFDDKRLDTTLDTIEILNRPL